MGISLKKQADPQDPEVLLLQPGVGICEEAVLGVPVPNKLCHGGTPQWLSTLDPVGLHDTLRSRFFNTVWSYCA